MTSCINVCNTLHPIPRLKGKDPMARAKTIGFAIPEDLLPDVEIVINEFTGGNRSEFLTNERSSRVIL
jgi:hypothetical protein